jgi:hypothetical protein
LSALFSPRGLPRSYIPDAWMLSIFTEQRHMLFRMAARFELGVVWNRKRCFSVNSARSTCRSFYPRLTQASERTGSGNLGDTFDDEARARVARDG